jgi:uncharacterized membrane protein YagU involved in acid resistance
MLREISLGGLGGVSASGAMTAVRLLARRLGVIDKMTPQAVEEKAAAVAGVQSTGPGHHIADHLLHLGYGAVWGALFGAVRRRPHVVRDGLIFGAAVWALAGFVLFPALGIARPAWRARGVENAVNLTAHAVYGLVTALAIDELAGQAHFATSDAQRESERVG